MFGWDGPKKESKPLPFWDAWLREECPECWKKTRLYIRDKKEYQNEILYDCVCQECGDVVKITKVKGVL